MDHAALSPAFRRLARSNLAAQLAEQLALAAVPLTAVLALGGEAGATGLLAMAQTLPFLLLALPLGVLADRCDRRRLMAQAEWVRAAALLAIPAAAWLGWLSLPLLGLFAGIAAIGTVAYSVAAPAIVPALVPQGALATANSRLELVRSIAYAGGPALAGALVGGTGTAVAFVAAALLSALAAILLAGLPEPPRAARPPHRRPLADLAEGAVFVWRHPLLRPIAATATVWNLSWFLLQAAYVPHAAGTLGLDAAGIGLSLAAYGAGMVAGAAAAPAVARALPIGRMIAVGPVVSVAAGGLMALSIAWPEPMVAGAGLFLFGAGPILWTIGQTTLRQAATPPELLGRVSALLTMATFGARPLGAGLGALVGAAWGPAPCILLAAAGFVAQAAIIAASAVPRVRTLSGAAPAPQPVSA
ncbi:MFS transporter [Allostella sp. ATCC 35155]|nr:MFS transporter [Stella sp. ATCC 35155]